MYDINYNGPSSYMSTVIWPEGLLYDAERDLLAIAKFLVGAGGQLWVELHGGGRGNECGMRSTQLWTEVTSSVNQSHLLTFHTISDSSVLCSRSCDFTSRTPAMIMMMMIIIIIIVIINNSKTMFVVLSSWQPLREFTRFIWWM